MKTVLIDMDEVLAQFENKILETLRIEHPEITIDTTRPTFLMSEDPAYQEHTSIIHKIKNRPGFFLTLDLMPHAVEGIQKVLDLGYHPRICSSPLKSNPTCREDKIAWLKEKLDPIFGSFISQEAILTSEKFKVPGLVLIDDKPAIKNIEQAKWRQIVFHHNYNANVKTELRLFGWTDERLPELLKYCSLAINSSIARHP